MTPFTIETIEPQPAAAIAAEVPMAEITSVFDRGMPAVAQAVEAQGVGLAGAPFGFYPRMPGETVAVVVGFPIAGAFTPVDDIEPFELPGGQAVTGVHVGPYDDLGSTYEQLMAWAQEQDITLAQGMWEVYLTDPGANPDPSTWQTQIVWPIV